MEDINLKELFLYLKEKMLFIAIITIIFLISGILYIKKNDIPYYKVTNRISLLNIKKTENEVIYSTIDSEMKNTYAEIIKSELVLSDISKEHNIDYNSLKSMLSVEANVNSSIITISINSYDKNQSENIMTSIINTLTKNANEFNIELKIIDLQKNANKYYNIDKKKILFISILTGIVLSISILLIVYFFGNKLISPYQLLNAFNDVVIISDPNSYNLFRNNLIIKNKKSIYITSTKSNIKKFDTTLSLANSFINIKEKVLLINCDKEINLSNYFNLQSIKNKKYNKCEKNNLYLIDACNDLTKLQEIYAEFDRIIINGTSILDDANTTLEIHDYDITIIGTELLKDKISNLEKSLRAINNYDSKILLTTKKQTKI